MHLLVKLVLAAPDSFLSAAALSHEEAASDLHLFMKLVRAAPASFFSAALSWQLGPAAAPPATKQESKRATAGVHRVPWKVYKETEITPRLKRTPPALGRSLSID